MSLESGLALEYKFVCNFYIAFEAMDLENLPKQ